MVFSSIEFIFYFLPLALLVYRRNFSRQLKYTLLTLLSGGFLAFGDPYGATVMAFTTILAMAVIQLNLQKFSLIVLAPLALFKYNTLFGLFPDNPLAQTALPLGISFYSFHLYSMVHDYAAGKFEFERRSGLKFNPAKLAAYVSFFPQLIAGPILRYRHFHRQRLDHPRLALGATLFFFGMFKKVALADTFALAADRVYATDPSILPSSVMWAGAIAYHLQIYFDFCGYSEMAIGLALMFGIRLPRNFRYPYAAQSFTDFWRRWHITLSRFFRDYLYIPLGGNRHGATKTYRNLLIVFLVTGAWHGNTINFIVWGLLHGGMLVVERAFRGAPLPAPPPEPPAVAPALSLAPQTALTRVTKAASGLRGIVLRLLYVNVLVILFWVPFRAADISDTLQRWSVMFQIPSAGELGKVLDFADPIHFVMLPVAMALSAPGWATNFGSRRFIFTMPGLMTAAAAFLLSILLVVGRGYSPFIHFRF